MSALAQDLTVAQVAAVMQCAEKTVRKLAARGKLRGYRVGREWRFEPSEVQAFRQRRQRTAPPASQKPKVPTRAGGHLPGWYDYDYGGQPS
jgi:excisionase family DNA binding protein